MLKDENQNLIRKTTFFISKALPGLEDAVVEEVFKGFTVDDVVPVLSHIRTRFRATAAKGFVLPCRVRIGGLYVPDDVSQSCGESDGNLQLCERQRRKPFKTREPITQAILSSDG